MHISNSSAQHFIETIAKENGLKYEEDHREYSLSFPEAYGHGYVKSFDFDNGVMVYEFDCTLEKDLHLIFDKETVQPLLILFNREEAITYAKHKKDAKAVNHLESIMVCSGISDTNALKIKSQQSTCFFVIRIDRKAFEEKIDSFLAEMDENLEEIFRDSNGVNPIFNQGYYSLDIAGFIEEFTTSELTGFMRHVFLEGKVYEILIHYLQQYLDDAKDPESRRILRQHTVDKIEEASGIIQEEMAVLGSIMTIAKRVGLNQNTLQDGFNHLFKKSVNQYIKDVRLDKAKELMENSNLNITEITYKIGINSRSYFSKVFKEKYGISPKQYISSNRKPENSGLSA